VISIADIIGWLLFAMLLLRFLVVVFNSLSRLHLPVSRIETDLPMVSVLIPARDEESTLPQLLSDLKECDYINLEIIVCDDHSSDGTVEILKVYQNGHSNFSYFTNEILPEGWVGKNFACYQLANRATGKYLLFLDADVRLTPDAISKAVTYASTNRVALLSVFPQQIMVTHGEWETVPLMNWILLSMLPLKAVRFPWFSSLSAANGQFMMFDTDVYRKNQWHKMVRKYNVEDILIARLMKKSKLRIAVLTGQNDIMCRMYSGRKEAIDGFSRNIHHYFGGNRIWMIIFTLLVLFRLPALAFFQQWWLFGGAVVIIFANRLFTAIISQQSVKKNFQNYFLQITALAQLVVQNLYIAQKRKMEWKGRFYKV
jgi:glycosyltransferase involved in cell wall biosynthesis